MFVKELSYAVHDFLLADDDFVKNPQVQFIFLLRNPHHTILSLYNKIKLVRDFDHLVGYRAAYTLFQKIKMSAAHTPIILFTEDLYQHPTATIQAVCDVLDIPFVPTMLSWEKRDNHFTGYAEWSEMKVPEQTRYWHKEALHSTGIHQPHTYKVGENGLPTFDVVDTIHRQYVMAVYHEHKRYYDALCLEKSYHLHNNKPKL